MTRRTVAMIQRCLRLYETNRSLVYLLLSYTRKRNTKRNPSVPDTDTCSRKNKWQWAIPCFVVAPARRDGCLYMYRAIPLKIYVLTTLERILPS
jgi:hypothetical protein